MSETQIDTRIPANDALIPYIQHANKVWGADDDILELARDYRDRDTFVDMCKVILVRDDMIEFPFEVAKFGGSPGGSPFAEFSFKVYDSKTRTSADHYILFGIDEDTERSWYVQLDDDTFVIIPWRDVSPAVIAHYVTYFYKKVRGI